MKRFLLKLLFFVFVTFSVSFADLSSAVSDDISKSLLKNRIIAGFLDIRTPVSAIRVNMQKVKDDGYNMVIISDGEVYENNIGFPNLSETSSVQNVVNQINNAKNNGMKVLLSVGGSPNTFHPGVKKGSEDPKVLGSDLTDEEIKVLANNIVNFLNKYNIDGILFGIKAYTSADFIAKLTKDIKDIKSDLIVAVEPEVNNYKLVTTGLSNDYDKAIESGNVDYIFIQAYNTYLQYDPNFISESYPKIVEGLNIPVHTKIIIEEPTNAVSGGTNTIYHPQGNATKSLSTKQAVQLMLPQFEKLKFKPRFAGVAGWSLNTDYAADLYGDSSHDSGSFARGLRDCIYKNNCSEIDNQISGPVVAGFLPLWGKSSSYNIFGHQINTSPIDISMPKNEEYCDDNPNICEYNVIIAAYLTYANSKGFELSLGEENGGDNKVYSKEELQKFISYMNSKGKHTLISIGGKYSHIDWEVINFDELVNIVKEYGFNGINFDLGNLDIPKDEKEVKLAASKINNLIKKLRQINSNFWVTFSPAWSYIVAPLNKNSKDNIYANHRYIELLDSIGLDKINYIFINTFAGNVTDSILSFDRNKDGDFSKVSSVNSYSKFLASLSWALTTQEGYNANMPKYNKVDKPLKIPAKKIVFIIPATMGAAHGGAIYSALEKDVKEAVDLMKQNKSSFAGFAIWSIDFDATNIKDGNLIEGYSHKPWSTTIAISNIDIPPVVTSQIKSNIDRKVNSNVNDKYVSLDKGIINYPDKIGLYNADTIVNFQGKKYKCKSSLEAKLCNDEKYSPGSLYGDYAWEKVDMSKNKLKEENNKNNKIKNGEIVNYPSFIGNYTEGQVVIAGDKKFECQKQELCNNKKYSPIGKKGYLAWTDVSSDVVNLDNEEQQSKPDGADYIYPNDIESYKAGTVVSVGKDLYRCKLGPESSLCNIQAYSPTSKKGADVWVKM